MNDYKVPQDVEAEDKLIGPFNFRQFIYLIIVALSGFAAFALFQMFPPLVVIPIPVILLFGALALPLRKDQPMEVYLAAVLSFHLKPRKRIWKPDGIEHLIEITAPKTKELTRTKSISGDEANRRLSYLSDVVDTGGWAIKHTVSQNSSIQEDFINEANATQDIFEEGRIASNIDGMIELNDQRRRQQIIHNMNTARDLSDYAANNSQNYTPLDKNQLYNEALQVARPQPTANLTGQPSQPDTIDENLDLKFNPYPDAIRQSIIQPIGNQPTPSQTQIPHPTQNTFLASLEKPKSEQDNFHQPSEDIIRLVSEGKDLSVETLARQANRIKEREIKAKQEREGDLSEEVVISLR